jgi:uncharacterized membrane protein YraQ (UPF0718 family)
LRILPLSEGFSIQARMNEKRLLPFAGTMIFTLVAIVGFAYVKWIPYHAKTFLAQSQHFIGDSILSGNYTSAPPVSWNAAVDYAIAYSKAIWKALLLGLILGSGIKVLLPTQWVSTALGRLGFKSIALGSLFAMPCMMLHLLHRPRGCQHAPKPRIGWQCGVLVDIKPGA